LPQAKMNEREIIIKESSRRYLDAFCIAVDSHYQLNWHHSEIIKKLERVESGEIKRLIILMPPRYGKSELGSIKFPAWYLGRNSDKEIIICSYSSDLATDFGLKTRDLVNSEVYKGVFGLKLREDQSAKSKWLIQGNKGGYTAVGIGGSITGRGANLLIIDDPTKNKEEAKSLTYREKVWNYYTSTLYTRLEKDAAIVIIITHWHLDDLVGRLLKAEKEGGEKWTVLKYPAIATQDEEYRKQGEPLWQDKYSLENLEQTKKTVGIYDWNSLYQQSPITSENQEFKPFWFKKRNREELAKLETRNFLTVDTAVSKKESADYTGIVRNYVDRENKWNISASKSRLSPTELIDVIFSLYKRDRYEKIGIEKTIYLMAIRPFLEDEMRKRNIFLPIVELQHHQTQKEIRIRGLIPRYESGSIFHIENECNDLEDELLSFPVGLNDDIIDAEAYQSQIAESPAGYKNQWEIDLIHREKIDNRKDFGL